MRKDGVLPRGDWFDFVMETDEVPKIYIYDEIGFWGTDASEFVKNLNKIDAPLMELHLNSPGGEVFDGLAIYNAVRQHKSEVHVYVDGLAASAASFIAQAGDQVIMARNATLMIHDGIGFAFGTEQDMLDTANILNTLSNNIADIYSEAANRRGYDSTLEDFRALMREEVWYTGIEARDAGLADAVLDTEDEDAQKATAKWDLSFYNHAGREQAESPLRVQEKIRLLNRQKENDMSQGAIKPQATADPPEGTPAPPPDDTPATEPEPDTEPAVEPVPEPAVVPAAAPEAPAEPTNRSGVMIDGKMVTDWAVIQAHFNTMSTAQAEQTAAHRQAFVEGLATQNKIPAPQVDSLVTLVNGDGDKVPAMSDDQFAAFQASYESTAPIGLFDNHATQDTPGGTVQHSPYSAKVETPAEHRSTLEGIVAMHRRTMPEDQVKLTPSYIELEKLTANES